MRPRELSEAVAVCAAVIVALCCLSACPRAANSQEGYPDLGHFLYASGGLTTWVWPGGSSSIYGAFNPNSNFTPYLDTWLYSGHFIGRWVGPSPRVGPAHESGSGCAGERTDVQCVVTLALDPSNPLHLAPGAAETVAADANKFNGGLAYYDLNMVYMPGGKCANDWLHDTYCRGAGPAPSSPPTPPAPPPQPPVVTLPPSTCADWWDRLIAWLASRPQPPADCQAGAYYRPGTPSTGRVTSVVVELP